MKLLIDGDVCAYRAGFASEKTKYLVEFTASGQGVAHFDDAVAAKAADGLVWSRKELQPLDQALLICNVMIGDIKARYAGAPIEVFLTGVGNFRHQYATRASYKGNRAGATPPAHLKAIREHLVARGAIVSHGEEADDLIGIAATAAPGSVVCSIDKDLMQLPGRHYNFVTKEEVTVSVKDAALNFLAQILSGDATDNIPGVAGIGPIKARKILEGIKSPSEGWARIVDVYTKEYGVWGFDYALEAARLVFVRRTSGQIWSPPQETSDAASQNVTRSNDGIQTEKAEEHKNEKGRGSRGVPKRARKGDSGRSNEAGSSV